MPSKVIDYDAIVVGAGFGGIRAMWELNQLGLTYKCFEAGSDVGGAWYWNRYPGARTDSEAWVYNMNFLPDLGSEFDFTERYPSQAEVQRHLGKIVDKLDLRKAIEFGTAVKAAHLDEIENIWTITTIKGISVSCSYFVAATGPLTVAKDPPFPGLTSYVGEWYQASKWPKDTVNLNGKRIAVIGTGATGVQIIPKIAPVADTLTVFQRTANYVLPGRNYAIDPYESSEIMRDYESTWKRAGSHPAGLAMTPSGRTVQGVDDEAKVRQILDAGWECGGFHFQFETFDDLFVNQKSNDVASNYICQKIRAVVNDPETAEKLCPTHPFLSKRPPCGHFYYEAYNRPNVKLVDIKGLELDIYEHGIRTSDGVEHEVDVIIFALGFDAATGALSEIDVRGTQNQSLRELWSRRVETLAGTLAPGFPNMFLLAGPQVPFGNMPVVLDAQVSWVGQTLAYMARRQLHTIDASHEAAEAWGVQVDEAFGSTIFAAAAERAGAWFVGANVPGKTTRILFYFGGVPTWRAWLDKEVATDWAGVTFGARKSMARAGDDGPAEDQGPTVMGDAMHAQRSIDITSPA